MIVIHFSSLDTIKWYDSFALATTIPYNDSLTVLDTLTPSGSLFNLWHYKIV